MPLTKFRVFLLFKKRFRITNQETKKCWYSVETSKYFLTESIASFECLYHLAFQVTSAGFFSGQLLVFSRGRKCLAEGKKKLRAITFFLHIPCIYWCLFLLIFHLSYVAWSRISSIYNNEKKYWKIVDPFQGPLTKQYDACWWKVLTASHNSGLESDSITSAGSIAQSSPSVLLLKKGTWGMPFLGCADIGMKPARSCIPHLVLISSWFLGSVFADRVPQDPQGPQYLWVLWNF